LNDAERTALRGRAAGRMRAAQQVLDELDLLARWSPFSEPVVVGSAALDLVVRPDIDVEFLVDELSIRDGFAVASAIAELPKVRSIRYNDARDKPEHGLYWKVLYELTPAETWTLDLWMFRRDHLGPLASSMVEPIRAALTPETRDTILAIKEAAAERGERAWGHWLYRAVINEGVRTYAEFLDWFGDRDIWAREAWTPRARS
jgi:hypothetical protein